MAKRKNGAGVPIVLTGNSAEGVAAWYLLGRLLAILGTAENSLSADLIANLCGAAREKLERESPDHVAASELLQQVEAFWERAAKPRSRRKRA